MHAHSTVTSVVQHGSSKLTRISTTSKGRRSAVSARMALQVQRWNAEKDGQLSTKTMLKRLKDEGYSGSIYQFPPGTHFGYHTHSCDKKDSIITGRFRFVSKDQGEVTLEPGDMLYVPKGMEHKAETIGSETVTFVDASKY
ncbi:hypothetical protein ABBQ38_005589 [Trebouxia sp. C0009 RCD-2024]